jgi:hypothetical protein
MVYLQFVNLKNDGDCLANRRLWETDKSNRKVPVLWKTDHARDYGMRGPRYAAAAWKAAYEAFDKDRGINRL